MNTIAEPIDSDKMVKRRMGVAEHTAVPLLKELCRESGFSDEECVRKKQDYRNYKNYSVQWSFSRPHAKYTVARYLAQSLKKGAPKGSTNTQAEIEANGKLFMLVGNDRPGLLAQEIRDSSNHKRQKYQWQEFPTNEQLTAWMRSQGWQGNIRHHVERGM